MTKEKFGGETAKKKKKKKIFPLLRFVTLIRDFFEEESDVCRYI